MGIFSLFKGLWSYITPQRKRQLRFLLLLMTLSSFLEMVSIGAVIPFLAVLVSPEVVYKYPLAQPLWSFLNITEPGQLVTLLTLAFGVSAIIAGLTRILLLWVSTKLSYAIGSDLGIDIFRKTLYQPYKVHTSRNSSEIISVISTKVNAVIGIAITPVLTIINSTMMFLVILFILLMADTYIALIGIGGFGLVYAILILSSQNKLKSNGARISVESTKVIKILQEGLGGIRDILIDGIQELYCKSYKSADIAMRRAQARNKFIGGSPRYVMESAGMILISLLAYILIQKGNGITEAIPILGTLALGAQRLLPVLQQGYSAWTEIRGGQAVLKDVMVLLDQQLPSYIGKAQKNNLNFNETIALNKVSFKYEEKSPWVLKDVDLSIKKGDCIGFIGTTGCGKSTMLDIIMGLLPPFNGYLTVDGEIIDFNNQNNWFSHIAHVPQTVFLADCSIEKNIAFGESVHEINFDRVKGAAKKAQIHEAIESWPDKYQTIVGERGARLSGGQRQRIGIARAFYKQSSILILDEATSALDNKTEQHVMKEIIESRGVLTVLIIAHRLTTLKECTKIVELSNGQIKQIGTYQQVINRN